MPAKLTVAQWRAAYLYGIPDTDPATGLSFPAAEYEYHLNVGYRTLEAMTDLAILPVEIEDERHDYYINDYQAWGWLRLFQNPTREVISIQGVYPSTNTVLTIPPEWIQLDPMVSHVQLVPAHGTLTQFIFTGSGTLIPTLFRYQTYVPQFWRINYIAGFPDDQIPTIINDAAAKIASMSVLNILGDLIGGVGVLGGSIGMDGLSQFVSMTKTATTAAFYSRVLQYRTELYGPSGTGGPGGMLHTIKRKYRGIRLINL